MSWFFGPSETSQALEQITQRFTEKGICLPVTLVSSTEILDETHKNKLTEILNKATLDFLYYHPKLTEVNDSVNHYFVESENNQINKQKSTESVKQTLSKIPQTQTEWITELLTNESFSTSYTQKLTEHLYSQLVEFLSNLTESEVNELNQKIDQAILTRVEFEKEQQIQTKKRQMMFNLASRVPDIMSQLKDSHQSDWLKLLIGGGIFDNVHYEQYLSRVNKFTLSYLSSLSEETLRQILGNVMAHKQMMENNSNKARDLEKMRQKATVKTNLSFLEHLNKNPPRRVTKIISTRSVTVPDVFVKQIGEIHSRKVEELKLPVDDKIYVKESYATGQLRLKGAKSNNKRFGTWVWYNKKGDTVAEYNYSNNRWSYYLNSKTTIKGHGSSYEPQVDNEEFLGWYSEALNN